MKNYGISIKDTIGIREFMVNYLGEEEYDCEGINTHSQMFEYLINQNKELPIKVSFKNIDRHDILSGRYLLVRNERRYGKKHYTSNKNACILAYRNPILFNINRIMGKLETEEDYEQAQNKMLVKNIKIG